MNMNRVSGNSCVAVAVKDSFAALGGRILGEAVAGGDHCQCLDQAYRRVAFGRRRFCHVKRDIEAIHPFGEFVGRGKLFSNLVAGRRSLSCGIGEFHSYRVDFFGAQTLLGLLAASETGSQCKKKSDLRQPLRKAMCVWMITGTKSMTSL